MKIYITMRYNFKILLPLYSPKRKNHKFIVPPKEINFMSPGQSDTNRKDKKILKIMTTCKKATISSYSMFKCVKAMKKN